ncbi:hypothetical protein [Gemmata massiliana]|uniref:hypothetical protein n=1 Tax=Gemmata massiliana TaxID=1210884 RepID=UPI001E45F71C|nr:hypothetical protein [Gemmata massiliana]
MTEASDKWYGAGIPGQGKKRVPLATDKEAAWRMLGDLVRAAERGEAKMLDRAAKAKSLKEHLADFEGELSAGVHVSTGRKRRTAPSAKQIQQSVQRVRDVLDGCNFRWMDDLKSGTAADRLARYLRERLKKPRNATDRGLGELIPDHMESLLFDRSHPSEPDPWLDHARVPGAVFEPRPEDRPEAVDASDRAVRDGLADDRPERFHGLELRGTRGEEVEDNVEPGVEPGG